jgi:hypothetical protein
LSWKCMPSRIGPVRVVPLTAGRHTRRDMAERRCQAPRAPQKTVSRLLDPADAHAAAPPAGLSFVESRPLGGAWPLEGLWRRLRIDTVLRPLVGSARREVDVERVLFALVANRAVAPSSKLAAAEWVCQDVHLPGLPHVTDDACYRVMDQLIEVDSGVHRIGRKRWGRIIGRGVLRRDRTAARRNARALLSHARLGPRRRRRGAGGDGPRLAGMSTVRTSAATRAWMYTVTTRVCLDAIQRRGRRALPADLGPASPLAVTPTYRTPRWRG